MSAWVVSTKLISGWQLINYSKILEDVTHIEERNLNLTLRDNYMQAYFPIFIITCFVPSKLRKKLWWYKNKISAWYTCAGISMKKIKYVGTNKPSYITKCKKTEPLGLLPYGKALRLRRASTLREASYAMTEV